MPFGQGRRVPTAADMAARMVQGAQNNAQKWLDATLSPTKNPKAEAQKANAKYKARMQDALQKDAWAKGIASYDEEAAVEAIRNAGTAAYTNGVASRQRKIQGKMEKLVPLLEQHLQTIDQMPTDTPAAAEQKMLANLRGMRAIGDKLKGS